LKKTLKNIFKISVLVSLGALIFNTQASHSYSGSSYYEQEDSMLFDTSIHAEGPQFKLKNDPNYPSDNVRNAEGIQLKNPSNLNSTVTYDPKTKQYNFENKIGNVDYRRSNSMSMKEYQKYEMRKSIRDYWKAQANGGQSADDKGFKPSFSFGGEAFDKIFGSSTISIIPQGQAELIFGVNVATIRNPAIPKSLQTTPSFNFEEKIQLNVTGTIGDRLKMAINYNTDATFEFENKTKIEYTGDEDDIIKKVEAGDVNLPLSGTLITGSQSLFGIKTEMQFGKLTATTVLSQQKGETSVIEVQGGAQVSDFEITSDAYDVNRHFFVAHYFKDSFDVAHAYLPRKNSAITITRMEVWLTNKNSKFEDARTVVGFLDLGEPFKKNMSKISNIVPNVTSPFPDNKSNSLYSPALVAAVRDSVNNVSKIEAPELGLGLKSGTNFEKYNARLLKPSEYTYDPQLGYISLNSKLDATDKLAVAYEYTYRGKTYKVGEFSSDINQTLVVKLIKGSSLSPDMVNWDLMMKNIYTLNAYQLSKEDFRLDVVYRDDKKGNDVNYLPNDRFSETTLISMLNLDKTNSQLMNQPDGVFDYIEGVTINSANGRIIFPMREPFGSSLRKKYQGDADALDPFLYQDLYDKTQTQAQLNTEKNKFKLKGRYKSAASSEIYLNAMNIPQGSVKVTAGGTLLREPEDYVVDYALGTVKILNSGVLSSGMPIKISLESNSMFNMQTKTLVGTHLDYKFNEDFNIGATILHLNERPLTKKVNIGEEPISNTIWGLNTTYRTNTQLLTTLVDKLPFLQTKEPSSITFTGEFAQLVPGSPKAIGKNGVAYIDDFEGSESSYDLKDYMNWKLASTPPTIPPRDPSNVLSYGFDRAKLAWYTIDRLFLINDSYTPSIISGNPEKYQYSHYVRQINEQEIYTQKQSTYAIDNTINILNLAYYPSERGPYNYDLNLNKDATLKNPEERWGGMMRALTTNDFEAANIEFIEFWLMDPYLEEGDTVDVNDLGGDIYIDLGNVSEDILKDNEKSFENGLPYKADMPADYKTTPWGRVPNGEPTSNDFYTNDEARVLQDVGLDCVNDSDEKYIFTPEYPYLTSVQSVVSNDAYNNIILPDPAGDNFTYFLNSKFDEEGADILTRYKNFNQTENNSPIPSGTETNSSTTEPDVEDLNGDNTLNTNENYYEYHIDLRKNRLTTVGDNFITDTLTKKIEHNPKDVRWLQFKIPINEFESKYGDISDFNSIQFMRVYLKNFKRPVVLRFASLDLVRGEWRKYSGSLAEGGESLNEQPADDGVFDIQAVNIEENSQKSPIPYRLPPGIDRVQDPASPQMATLNEQSMLIRVKNLNDGESRAAFKTAMLDMRQYKRLKMFAHCEKLNYQPLNDNDLSVFIRIGSDYTNNYYEYEVPLKVTRDDNLNSLTLEDIWPTENEFNIELAVFQRLKQLRNEAMRNDPKNVTYTTAFLGMDGNNKIAVCGNPSLSEIRTIMIGIRNPAAINNPYANDGMAKSAEIWVNELRLTDFSDKGGWAANARLQTKLADFGMVNLSGSTIQPGFGSIEKKVNERAKEETNQYDISTNLELGKFFPEKAQVKVPMFASLSETFINPEYDPEDPDIPLQAALDNAKSAAERKAIKKRAQDYTRRRSLNFTNVKVNKTSKKPQFYDPANFSINYGYSDVYARNINIDYSKERNYQGGINYLYNVRPKNVTPLRSVKALNNPAFRIIKDLNFYYAPTSLGFRTELKRDYRETKIRNLSSDAVIIKPTVEKNFTWTRIYDVKYDLTRALKIDFTATNTSRINEDTVALNKNNSNFKHERKLIRDSLLHFGQTTNYNQQINATYTVPINKLPLLDWTSLNTRYSATYGWDYEPILVTENDTISLGNTIKNGNSFQLNGQANFSTIYNKIPIIRDLNSKRGKGKDKPKDLKTVTFEKTYPSLKAGVPKNISHKLGTEDVTVKVKDAKGNDVPGTTEVVNINRVIFTPNADVTGASVSVEGKVEAGQNPFIIIARNLGRMAIGVKNISASYTNNGGTTLPGYMNKTEMMGATIKNGKIAPGIPFLLGVQDDNIVHTMGDDNEWLVRNNMMNTPVLMNTSRTINIRSTIEPLPGLKIDLTANHSYSENKSFLYDEAYVVQPPIKSGNFSMSIISINSFENLTSGNDYRSKEFETFKTNRAIISARLVAKWENRINSDTVQRSNGYSETSQEVLIPAFLGTYSNLGINNVPMNLIPDIKYIRPNWRINYDGLSDIPIIQDYLQSITLNHTYSSTYNIGSFTTSLDYKIGDGYIYSYARDLMDNYVPEFNAYTVSINEQFSPFFGVDMTWKSGLTTRFEYKKSRTLGLNISNSSLSESRSKEYVVGMGYRFEEVPLIFTTMSGTQSSVKSDLNVRADVSWRDDITALRMIEKEIQSPPTAGTQSLKISFSADYALSDKLNLRFFFDRSMVTPHTSGVFKTINTDVGFSVRFTLAQ
jgi:cell surface protein SprA